MQKPMKKMRNLIVVIAVFGIVLSSCKNSQFEREFSCDTPMSFSSTKTYKDVLSHFEIDVPKNWKTSLYYDEYQSKLYTADTTRNLSESYIIDVSWHQGELIIDDDLERLVSEQVGREFNLIPVKAGKENFSTILPITTYPPARRTI